MSISEVNRTRRMVHKDARKTEYSIMVDGNKSKLIEAEAFKYFASGLINLEIAALLHISYTEVIALRMKYERRCKK